MPNPSDVLFNYTFIQKSLYLNFNTNRTQLEFVFVKLDPFIMIIVIVIFNNPSFISVHLNVLV